MTPIKTQVEKAVTAVKEAVAPEQPNAAPAAPPTIPRPAGKPRVIMVVGQRVETGKRK